MSTKKILTLIPLTFILGGCVIAVGDHDYDDEGMFSSDGNSSSWKEIQLENRNNMTNLVLGQSRDQVNALMGKPAFTEAFTHENGKVYSILFFRTHREHGDGETTKDETTPVVLEDGFLVGWGNDALQRIR